MGSTEDIWNGMTATERRQAITHVFLQRALDALTADDVDRARVREDLLVLRDLNARFVDPVPQRFRPGDKDG
jgi:hypothetical protein